MRRKYFEKRTIRTVSRCGGKGCNVEPYTLPKDSEVLKCS